MWSRDFAVAHFLSLSFHSGLFQITFIYSAGSWPCWKALNQRSWLNCSGGWSLRLWNCSKASLVILLYSRIENYWFPLCIAFCLANLGTWPYLWWKWLRWNWKSIHLKLKKKNIPTQGMVRVMTCAKNNLWSAKNNDHKVPALKFSWSLLMGGSKDQDISKLSGFLSCVLEQLCTKMAWSLSPVLVTWVSDQVGNLGTSWPRQWKFSWFFASTSRTDGHWHWYHYSLFFLSVWLWCPACGILVPWPGIEPTPLSVEVQSPNTGLPGNSQDDYSKCHCLWRLFHKRGGLS